MLHHINVAEVPVDRHPAHVVAMRLERLGVVISADDDLHPRLLQAQAQTSRPAEEVGCEENAGVLPAKAAQRAFSSASVSQWSRCGSSRRKGPRTSFTPGLLR